MESSGGSTSTSSLLRCSASLGELSDKYLLSDKGNVNLDVESITVAIPSLESLESGISSQESTVHKF